MFLYVFLLFPPVVVYLYDFPIFVVQVATSSHHWQGGARKVRGENRKPC